MLLRFRVTNHASLRDEQELSLVADDTNLGRAEGSVPRTRHRVVPVAAIFGGNASGKSNMIDAMLWMRSAVLSSFQRWSPAGGVPWRPFAFRSDSVRHPSTYEIEFVVDGVRYEYGFSVTAERVEEEWLFAYPNGKVSKLYARTAEKVDFGRALAGRKSVIAELLRPNSLYLSVAAAQGHELLGNIYRWFRLGFRTATDRDFTARLEFTVKMCLEGGPVRAAMINLLRLADLGVTGLDVREPEEARDELLRRLEDAVRNVTGDEVVFDVHPNEMVRVEHEVPDGVFSLMLDEESSGTRTWIGLLGPVVTALLEGAVLCVDELDARLHPYLTDALVRLFQSPETNVNGAQLVFSTHEASLLGRNSRTELGRDQIWFTEMGRARATRLFPLTEFQVRTTESLERRYLTGRYGAVPYFDDELLSQVVLKREGGDGRATGEASGATHREPTGAA